MSNPSFSNIDLWLFELAEGNLSPEQVEQLELFLLHHPELDVDRDMWELSKVDNTPVTYPEAASLERKRKPAAIYLGSLLLLFLVGSATYGIWSQKVAANVNADVIAQQQRYTQDRLQHDIANLQEQLDKNKADKRSTDKNGSTSSDLLDPTRSNADNLNETRDYLGRIQRDYAQGRESNGVNNTGAHSGSQIDFVAWNRGSAIQLNALKPQNNGFTAGNAVGFDPNDPNNQNNPNGVNNPNNTLTAQQPLSLDPVNSIFNRFDTTELADIRIGAIAEIGQDDFQPHAATEIDFYAEDRWKLRNSSVQYSSGTSGGHHSSFKRKLKGLSRSIKRMMDNPIALKNSRDPHFHVPGMTSNDISFSSAGTLISTRVQAMSRIQWLGKENEQLMSELAIDGYSYGIRGGWGIQLNHAMYKDGGIHMAQVAMTYSPKFSVSNWISVEPSLRFKMGDKLLNSSLMTDASQVELDRGVAHDFYPNGNLPIGRNLWYKDVGVGLLVNTKWFFVGVQADNLFKYKDNIYANDWIDPRRAGNHFIATIGTDWLSRRETLGLSPYVVYQKNEQLTEVWAGVNFKWNSFNLGIATTEKLDPAASIGLKFDQFSLHYNADYTTSAMTGERALSHQVTMRIQGKQSRSGQRLFKM